MSWKEDELIVKEAKNFVTFTGGEGRLGKLIVNLLEIINIYKYRLKETEKQVSVLESILENEKRKYIHTPPLKPWPLVRQIKNEAYNVEKMNKLLEEWEKLNG